MNKEIGNKLGWAGVILSFILCNILLITGADISMENDGISLLMGGAIFYPLLVGIFILCIESIYFLFLVNGKEIYNEKGSWIFLKLISMAGAGFVFLVSTFTSEVISDLGFNCLWVPVVVLLVIGFFWLNGKLKDKVERVFGKELKNEK